MIIRPTNKTSINGLPLIQMKIDGKFETFEQNEAAGELHPYDESVNNISFSFESKDEEKTTIIREETKKLLRTISENRILGLHEYFHPKTDRDMKAIVIWNKRGDKWFPSSNKGVSNLVSGDIAILNSMMTEMSW